MESAASQFAGLFQSGISDATAGSPALPPRDFLKLDDGVVESLSDNSLSWMARMESDGQSWWAWADGSGGDNESGISKRNRITKRSRPSWTSDSGASSRRQMQQESFDSSLPRASTSSSSSATGRRDLKQLVDRLDYTDQVSGDEYAALLKKCGSLRALDEGRRVHAHILLSNRSNERFIANLLVEMYGKCGSLENARAVFDGISRKNLFSWNIILAAYAQNGHEAEALSLFQRMDSHVPPDKFTYSTVISACSTLGALEQGIAIHKMVEKVGLEAETVVGTSLVNMYGRCHSLGNARLVFERIPCKDAITWNAIVTAYAQDGSGKEALEIFQRMQQEGVKTGSATFISVLEACASTSALALGRVIHQNLVANGLDRELIVATALVNMYAKCGKLVEAREVFDQMEGMDVVAWTAIVAGSAQHGHIEESKDLMRRMELEGIKPNNVTFLSLVYACSHSGYLDEARDCFIAMADHGFFPLPEHFRCVIDLLGRGGRLEEAQEVIDAMPFEPGLTAWLTMLSACRLQKDVLRAEIAAEKCYEIEPTRPSAYLLMSNLYAALERWDDVEKVRRLMERRGVKKEPGLSCIEVKNRLHEFGAADKSHPQKDLIYEELRKLTLEIKEAGYVPDTSLVLHNVDEETKQATLFHHSERLAVVYGLINTPPGTSLCVVNNLRMCSDCHTAFKYISTISNRQIVVRDANRFHTFATGGCSCKDYW
ncbi:pentatricopeptide repeat-containing protein At4g21065 [Selaginella moellendorffii]|nr:pentatricopeptide repeat-containing protein At4g21065 [Selaginella moellendorffii]XP_024533004.1 pentatricopeptide repeat-containing protein At4g21065 [Selaginella moellendorffii]|eukprot:XP_024533003.1 pentatricopeptide repeat-containing protein At4g21065 [Selaginella moellendorffii]